MTSQFNNYSLRYGAGRQLQPECVGVKNQLQRAIDKLIWTPGKGRWGCRPGCNNNKICVPVSESQYNPRLLTAWALDDGLEMKTMHEVMNCQPEWLRLSFTTSRRKPKAVHHDGVTTDLCSLTKQYGIARGTSKFYQSHWHTFGHPRALWSIELNPRAV